MGGLEKTCCRWRTSVSQVGSIIAVVLSLRFFSVGQQGRTEGRTPVDGAGSDLSRSQTPGGGRRKQEAAAEEQEVSSPRTPLATETPPLDSSDSLGTSTLASAAFS